MLAAQDKEQVRKWSERQLGIQARLASISEKEVSEAIELVEKSGTGIKAREAEGCQPVMSIMANFVQCMSDAEEGHTESDLYISGPRLKGMKPTLH